MPENKNQNVVVSKGVARGHILCCVSVVFICFMLTCLNLYMMSSTRSVLRHLDARLDARPDGLFQQRLKEAASAMDAMQVPIQVPLQAPLQVGEGDDDFILLAPSDLDNAWTTSTGRLLVPVGQPEDDDNGWKQMQVQLGEQTSAQQRHIDSLHDKLADQYRAREELQRDQQNLLREHHKLSMEHQKQIAKKDRQLLKEKHRALQQGAQHQDEVRRYQSELETLKQAVEGVMQPSDATTTSAPVKEPPTDSNSTTTILEVSIPVEEAAAPEAAVPADTPPVVNPLDHIFSAVFGPSPGTFFFPSSRPTSRDTEEQHRVVNRVLDSEEHARRRRDLSGDRAERRQRRLALLQSRLGDRKRRHDQDDAKGPLMRIDEGQMVPLSSVPAVMDSDSAFSRRRRHQGLLAARHG